MFWIIFSLWWDKWPTFTVLIFTFLFLLLSIDEMPIDVPNWLPNKNKRVISPTKTDQKLFNHWQLSWNPANQTYCIHFAERVVLMNAPTKYKPYNKKCCAFIFTKRLKIRKRRKNYGDFLETNLLASCINYLAKLKLQ